MNEISALITAATKKLYKAHELLILEGHEKAAEILKSEILRLDTVSRVHLVDLAKVQAPTIKKQDSFEIAFYRIWPIYFPNYGLPSQQDRAALRQMLPQFRSAFPQANEIFLERVIKNFQMSTGDWLSGHEITLFARHFRKFYLHPIHPSGNGAIVEVPSLQPRV